VIGRIAIAMRRSSGGNGSLADMSGKGGLMFVRTICLGFDSGPVVVQEDAVLCVMVVRRSKWSGRREGGCGGGERLISEILGAMGQVVLRHSFGCWLQRICMCLLPGFPKGEFWDDETSWEKMAPRG
jgi:hypothetical protein